MEKKRKEKFTKKEKKKGDKENDKEEEERKVPHQPFNTYLNPLAHISTLQHIPEKKKKKEKMRKMKRSVTSTFSHLSVPVYTQLIIPPTSSDKSTKLVQLLF